MVKQEFQTVSISSRFLNRQVIVDIYHSVALEGLFSLDLLLINDGQDLLKMNFSQMIKRYPNNNCQLLAIGIHAGVERKLEYGVAGFPDYMNRGTKAEAHAKFVLEELIPRLKTMFPVLSFKRKFLAGFSLGGLMAFDMAMDYPEEFSAIGVFSGSFWWRSKALDKGYVEEDHRIMHAKIRTKAKHHRLKFFLQTGQLDEAADRNNNGIIDSIDDTIGVIDELNKIGYSINEQITYLELADGKHDVETWGRVMPDYLKWLSRL